MSSRIQIPVWEEYKMQFGAMASLNKNTLNIEVDYDVKNLEKVIYMFVFDSEIVRIGSSKAKFYQRMRRYELDITKSLNNKKSSTPDWEAQLWKQYFDQFKTCKIYVREGTVVKTPVGKISSYLDEESYLIGKHQPPLNRSKHR